MKITRFTFIAALLAALTLASPAHAEKQKTAEKAAEPAAATPATPAVAPAANGVSYKIAVVDMPKIIKDYKKREAKYSDLQKEVDRLQGEIEAMGKAIEAKKKKYETDGPGMKEDDRFALKQEIEKDFANYKSELEGRQRKIDGMEEEVLKGVLGEIKATIQEIATSEGYHLVLNSNGAQGAVVYASDTIDITPKVLGKLNGGAASSAAPAPSEVPSKKK